MFFGGMLAAMALFVSPQAAMFPPEFMNAGLRGTGEGKIFAVDFDGDGRFEWAALATVVDPGVGARIDRLATGPSATAPRTALRRGETVLAVTAPTGGVRVFRIAGYRPTLLLSDGRHPECRSDTKLDAIYLERGKMRGALAWKGDRFIWINCGISGA